MMRAIGTFILSKTNLWVDLVYVIRGGKKNLLNEVQSRGCAGMDITGKT